MWYKLVAAGCSRHSFQCVRHSKQTCTEALGMTVLNTCDTAQKLHTHGPPPPRRKTYTSRELPVHAVTQARNTLSRMKANKFSPVALILSFLPSSGKDAHFFGLESCCTQLEAIRQESSSSSLGARSALCQAQHKPLPAHHRAALNTVHQLPAVVACHGQMSSILHPIMAMFWRL